MSDDAYRVPTAAGEAELREKGSRFLAVVAPVGDETAARAVIDRLAAEHRDATHVCFAWRLALAELPRSERVPTEELRLELPYDRLGAVQGLLDPPRVELAEADYAERVRLTLRVQKRVLAGVLERLADVGVETR